MLHSLLISGGSLKDRKHQAQESSGRPLKNSPDSLVLESQTSLGIASVKTLKRFLVFKTYQAKSKVVFILRGEKLTLPAQHALLKIVEEPPLRSLIIILSSQESRLVETLVSRCQLVRLKPRDKLNKNLKQAAKFYDLVCQSNLGQRITLAHTIPDKVAAQNLVKQQLALVRHRRQLNSLTEKLLACNQHLEANVNPKLALENLLLHYPKRA